MESLASAGDDGLLMRRRFQKRMLAQKGGSTPSSHSSAFMWALYSSSRAPPCWRCSSSPEAADNRRRYAILKKIGAGNNLLSRAIFKQIAIYFLIPLFFACLHSVVGIKVANDAIREVGSLNALANILLTAVLILFIYGAYFLATYFGSRRIILKGDLNSEYLNF